MNKILVVDDEQQILVALQETLKRKGYAVSTASSAVEALRKLEKKFYRAVITDVRMPELDGMELLKEVKRLSPGTPVILLTGHGTVDHAVEALKQGAFDYLMKPFSAEQLTEVVERATSLVWRSDKQTHHNVITCDPRMEEVLALAEQASQTDFTVLIEAESGTGKELLARYIHNCSKRSGKAMQEIDHLQNESHQEIEKILGGDITDVHSAMIAMQKADLSFQMMMQIRNKLVEAYHEIMRMQV